LIKFRDYAVKKAFAVFITCNEEWELTDISKTFESDLLDNWKMRRGRLLVGGEGTENAENEVSETKRKYFGGLMSVVRQKLFP
jgi:hypothetical protein